MFLIGALPPTNEFYDTRGQKHWFVTANGAGSCISWQSPCTFRTAVSKCTDDYQDVIWLSPEDHDTDNGADATGTTITAKNVRIVGVSNSHSFNARLHNTAAVVTYVVQVTGHRVSFENIRFTQDGDTDVDATLLHTTGNRTNVLTCQFISAPGAAADVGILVDGGSQYHYFEHVHIDGFQTVGFRTNDASEIEGRDIYMHDNVLAMHFAHADDEDIELNNVELAHNTTGIQLAAGVDDVTFENTLLVHNTTNVVDGGTWGGLHMINTQAAHSSNLIYPANAGVAVAGDGAAWTQGNLVQIVPASTITTPFKITGFNIQSATANNVYKVELFWGEATGDNTIGVYEFIDVGGVYTPPPVTTSPRHIPSNSYVGAKLASSTGGDTATITINYEAL